MTAMNKKFSVDQYISFIDQQKIKNVLRFYQSTVSIQELYYENNIEKEKAYDNFFDLPESFIESITFDKLSNNEKKIIDRISDFLESQKHIYFLPVFIVSQSNELPSGIYSVDFKNRVLYKYKEFNEHDFGVGTFEDSFNICIAYFIDLYESVFLDGEAGLINGILQIGRIYENIEFAAKENGFETFSKFVSQQSFSHNIGINCRTQLFIKNQFLRGI